MKIGLIIRGKHSEDHNPELMAQHADVVLSTGAPFGFFGTGRHSSAATGMFMDGVVANYSRMQMIRPFYVNADKAKEANVVSTVCLIEVTTEQAARFDDFWMAPSSEVVEAMRGFSILGGNCSTAANAAFVYAGVLGEEIPGLDTPNGLFRQLRSKYGPRFSCQSGYVGFQQAGSKFGIEVLKP